MSTMSRLYPGEVALRPVALAVGEIVVVVAAATGLVALLDSTAPAVGLGILYLLAVLTIAVRRGQIAALMTALVSVLTLNYLFLAPRHRLAIAHLEDFVELCVLLITAIVVGRLAAAGRRDAAEAERRAQAAAAREREAQLIARAASAVLAGQSISAQLEGIGVGIAAATDASQARIGLGPVPSPREQEMVLPLPTQAQRAWLYVDRDSSWARSDLERIAEPLGKLLDVAVERERMADGAAETEAARRADVARTAILHAISHDLRSPLTAITTAASALRSPGLDEGERAELVDVIEADGQRLARLVADLLDLSRIEAGAVAPLSDWCDLREIVSAAAAQAAGSHPVAFGVPEEFPLVRADAAQLERVFVNLIENAVKFSPADQPIRISGGRGSTWVTVRVSDRGAGIPKSHRMRVFEPFFRGGDHRGGGSGLGLAICRGFVEANGGRITLHSRTGEGTTITVSFPLVRQPAATT